ncbi:MAG: hypothetical protein QOH31_5616 [Verrucomicrobiota bacterium]|jgi:hypothetical protein
MSRWNAALPGQLVDAIAAHVQALDHLLNGEQLRRSGRERPRAVCPALGI